MFGVEWANDAIIPKVMAMAQHPNYLYRMTTCFAISVGVICPRIRHEAHIVQTLAPVITLDIIKESILPMLGRLVTDLIPNIRFNVAKSYAVLIDTLRRLPAEGTLAKLEKSGTMGTPSAKGQDLISSQILPNLEKLQQDDDVDVRYFATIAVSNHAERMEISP